MTTEAPIHRAGHAAIIGRPNVGKSTLLNRILQQKISITSHKPHTTWHRLLGIYSRADAQVAFVDTPGIHRGGKKALNRYLNRTALAALEGVDVVVFLLQGTRVEAQDRVIMELLRGQPLPVIAAVNKIDRLERKDDLLPLLQELEQTGGFAEIVPLSALRGNNVEELIGAVVKYLPVGPALFEADQVTDRPVRFLAGEIVREKLIRRLNQELPYGCTVVIERFTEAERQTLIHAMICVERESQKAIVIGKGGQVLKQIGQQARIDLEKLLMRPVYLHLWVKVRSGWADEARALRELGYVDPRDTV